MNARKRVVKPVYILEITFVVGIRVEDEDKKIMDIFMF